MTGHLVGGLVFVPLVFTGQVGDNEKKESESITRKIVFKKDLDQTAAQMLVLRIRKGNDEW